MGAGETAFGPFVLDRSRVALLRDGKTVAIGQRGYALLEALLAADAVVDKAALMEAGWPGTIVEEGNLTVQIAALRKVLGPREDGQEWIVTVPRVGYRLVRAAGTAASSAREARAPSVAVLPFHNLSGDPEQDYFADGVVEDIITALSRFKSLAVMARNSSFVFRGRTIDVREAAAQLGVRYVLEGSVRKASNRLRVAAQLIDGVTGAHLWAQTFDGSVDDVFDMQDRITEGTAAIIEPKIRDAEFQASRRERPDSIAAYDLYLRALHKYDTVKPAENAEAIALLDRAIALDPEYAPALALAAEAREHRLSSGWPLYAEDDVERAIALANAAIERTKDDASVLALSGMVLLQVAHDYDRALAVFDRALAANPRDIDVVFNTGVANILGGDIERAEMLFHRTIKLAQNEGGHIAMTGLGHIEMLRGNYEAALDWLSGSAAVDPNFSPTLWMRIACNAYLGRMDEAARLLVELREKAPGVTIARIMQTQRSRPLERHEVIMRGLRLAGLPDI